MKQHFGKKATLEQRSHAPRRRHHGGAMKASGELRSDERPHHPTGRHGHVLMEGKVRSRSPLYYERLGRKDWPPINWPSRRV